MTHVWIAISGLIWILKTTCMGKQLIAMDMVLDRVDEEMFE